MTVVFANNAAGELALGINAFDVSLNLVGGQGARFPNPGAGNYFIAVIQNGATYEVVHVTAVATDTLTIVRGQEGTTPSTFAIGSTVEMRVTKGLLETFRQVGDSESDEVVVDTAEPWVTLVKDAGNPAGVRTYVGANLRWQMELGDNTAEGGSNAGSDFRLKRYADNGTLLGTPLFVDRSDAAMSLQADVTVQNFAANGGVGNANLTLNKEASAKVTQIIGATNGLMRWNIQLGNGTAESGSGAGSDFGIYRYDDAGAYVDNPLFISRSTGVVKANLGVVAPSYMLSEASEDTGFYSGGDGTIAWKNNGVFKGSIVSTGVMTLVGGAVVMQAAASGATLALHCNTDQIGFTNSSASAWLARANTSGDWTATGNLIAYSDQRLKANVRTIDDALALVQRLRGVRFERKDRDYKPGIGVIAQEVQGVVPEVVHDTGNFLGVSHDGLVGVLIEAVKVLADRVAALEAKG